MERSSQEAFFRVMWPFLEGRSTVDDVVGALGPSRSGAARLALYPELVRRQKRGILDHFFAASRAACDAADPQLWEELASQLVREVAPCHWEPNHYARLMLAFLEAAQQRDARISAAVVELADFAWIRFSAALAPHEDGPGAAMDRSIFVRQYTHDVASFTTAVERGDAAPGAAPEARPCTLLMCRSRHTAKLEIVRPSLAALLALRRREAPDDELRIPGGLTLADIEREDAALVALGVLGVARSVP